MRLYVALSSCIAGAAVFAIPNMTRRGARFGYAVPSNFRDIAIARKTVAEFRTWVVTALTPLLATLFLSPVVSSGLSRWPAPCCFLWLAAPAS
jgi:hypothetical protein